MIVEMRTYTLALGATGRYFKLYGEKGLAVQKRILGHLAPSPATLQLAHQVNSSSA